MLNNPNQLINIRDQQNQNQNQNQETEFSLDISNIEQKQSHKIDNLGEDTSYSLAHDPDHDNKEIHE